MKDLIDTHFHLDFYKNHKKIYSDINALHQYTLCMTNSPEIYKECQKLYWNTKYVKFALGFNPKEIHTQNSFKMFLNMFKGAEYIGEIGLDFSSKYIKSKEYQLEWFEKIIELCSKDNKLISIHVVESEKYIINILKKYKPQKCIIHWYNGNEESLKELIKIGCYFSINTNMIKKNNSKLFLIPKEKLLIESDGPFTSIEGKKFEPRLLKRQYEIIAEYFNIDNIEETIYNNFKCILEL